jgi:hypothetical protein
LWAGEDTAIQQYRQIPLISILCLGPPPPCALVSRAEEGIRGKWSRRHATFTGLREGRVMRDLTVLWHYAGKEARDVHGPACEAHCMQPPVRLPWGVPLPLRVPAGSGRESTSGVWIMKTARRMQTVIRLDDSAEQNDNLKRRHADQGSSPSHRGRTHCTSACISQCNGQGGSRAALRHMRSRRMKQTDSSAACDSRQAGHVPGGGGRERG